LCGRYNQAGLEARVRTWQITLGYLGPDRKDREGYYTKKPYVVKIIKAN
jgi:hypothetical protein